MLWNFGGFGLFFHSCMSENMSLYSPNSMDMSLSKLQELVMDREGWLLRSTGLQRVSRNWAAGQQQQIFPIVCWIWASLVAQGVKRLPAMQETRVEHMLNLAATKRTLLNKWIEKARCQRSPEERSEPISLNGPAARWRRLQANAGWRPGPARSLTLCWHLSVAWFH